RASWSPPGCGCGMAGEYSPRPRRLIFACCRCRSVSPHFTGCSGRFASAGKQCEAASDFEKSSNESLTFLLVCRTKGHKFHFRSVGLSPGTTKWRGDVSRLPAVTHAD